MCANQKKKKKPNQNTKHQIIGWYFGFYILTAANAAGFVRQHPSRDEALCE